MESKHVMILSRCYYIIILCVYDGALSLYIFNTNHNCGTGVGGNGALQWSVVSTAKALAACRAAR